LYTTGNGAMTAKSINFIRETRASGYDDLDVVVALQV
jgi:hypothetical protein